VSARTQRDFTPLQRLLLAVLPPIVELLLRLMALTWRFEVIAPPDVQPRLRGKDAGKFIYCFWHQCVIPATVYFTLSHATILISSSFDGELITRILRRFGYSAVRGSSSRGGREGLMGLVNTLQHGGTAIFTADGPRGPIYQTKMGPIKLAQLAGVPAGGFHLEPARAWVLNSWDRFLVPRPFTRICVSWAEWTHVPADWPDDRLEEKRLELNGKIEAARHRAYAHLGKDAAA
jgi:lysophospholipid acyltransferase (LPLAT)-like uncharacterized protein